MASDDDDVDDAALLRRSVRNYGELMAAVGRYGVGPHAEVRQRGLLGAHIPASRNAWLGCCVVPMGETPDDDAAAKRPYCVWSAEAPVPGRAEQPAYAMPCMGLLLGEPALQRHWAELVQRGTTHPDDAALAYATPTPGDVADLNELAYVGHTGGLLGRVMRAMERGLAADGRLKLHGLRAGGPGAPFLCVAITLQQDDDVGLHYVATAAAARRHGLATALLSRILRDAATAGGPLRTATLQATAAGAGVYRRLGFRDVGVLRAYLLPDPPTEGGVGAS